MTLADIRERKRRSDLAQVQALMRQLGRSPTELELRTAARALRVEDHLPEPQDELELPGAA